MGSYSLADVRERELYPGFFGKVIHSQNMSLVFWRVNAGSPLPAHEHPHEQVITVLEGKFELRISGGATRVLGPGEIAVIAGTREHAGRALTDCKFLDVCYPIRQGYLAEE